MKFNLQRLSYSIPNRKEFASQNNPPNLTRVRVSEGIIQPPAWISSIFLQEKKAVLLSWDTNPYSTGSPYDQVYAGFICWNIPNILNWSNKNKPWKNLYSYFDAINPIAKREDGSAIIYIPKSIKIKNNSSLITYLFLSDTKKFNYSISIGAFLNSCSHFLK